MGVMNKALKGFKSVISILASYDSEGNLLVDQHGNPYGNVVVSPNPFIAGTEGTLFLTPDAADAADVNAERYSDAVGVKGFRMFPKPGGVASVTAIVFAWSTTADDLAAVNGIMAAMVTSEGTPDGVVHSNGGIIYPSEEGAWTDAGMWYGDTDWKIWDGTTKIKTIAARSVGADFTDAITVKVIV